MPNASELLHAILRTTDATGLPPWAEDGAHLPDGRTAYYAELPADPLTTVAVHQLAGAPPTVVELTPATPPHHLTPAEARSLAAALLAAATLAPPGRAAG